jgi:hypothetical protein
MTPSPSDLIQCQVLPEATLRLFEQLNRRPGDDNHESVSVVPSECSDSGKRHRLAALHLTEYQPRGLPVRLAGINAMRKHRDGFDFEFSSSIVAEAVVALEAI